PKERDLQAHHDQLLVYWSRLRPRFMVLCNFHEFWIYDTDEEGGQNTPVKTFHISELPGNAGALNFLGGAETFFAKSSAEVTREAAGYIGQFLRDIIHRSPNAAADRPRYTKFTLECVFAMFAEDVGILPTKPFTQAMKSAQLSGDMSPVYNLFDDLGRASESDRSNLVPYVNGPLFDRDHPKVPVDKELLANLFIAADKYDWQAVRPEVFGSIFERSLFPDERHSAGAHFTSEADIMKVVGPTIVRPWRERIKACLSHKDIEQLIVRMQNYHVLDPACGSGNFLYVAYRELKRLELELRNRHTELYRAKAMKRASDLKPPPPGPYFTIQQLHGIDKLPEAVQLTRVVLWIAQYLANQELGLGEATLPLSPLEENVIEADALFTEWFPREEDDERELAIVGNPPFMGRAKMRAAMGDEYIDSVHKLFPNNRNADLVTYWYTQALVTLRDGERAGFVSSNSIAQNESREASLDKIVASAGVIHDAWKSYPWPGEAAVHVSIVNWIQGEYGGSRYLNGHHVLEIPASLD
ncbi:MAG: N-6 DNA methylase, partial [bacterium]|nr:N-6 DNA methylase [bacterium]